MSIIEQLTPEERIQVAKEEIAKASNSVVADWILQERKKNTNIVSFEVNHSFKPYEEDNTLTIVTLEINYAVKN